MDSDRSDRNNVLSVHWEAHGHFVLRDVSSDIGISIWKSGFEKALYFSKWALKSGQIQTSKIDGHIWICKSASLQFHADDKLNLMTWLEFISCSIKN